MKQSLLRGYARLIAVSGANVQPGQEFFINAGLDQPEFVTLLVEECYKAGAKKVVVEWSHQPVSKLHYQYRSLKTLSHMDKYDIARWKHFAKVLPARIYVDSEESIKSILLAKWKRHRELTEILTGIIKKYGLSEENIKRTLRRSLGIEREEFKGNRFTLVNNDCVEETMTMPDNSVDLICTSIPFSNHYEYCASYNDFGHNSGNDTFFQQMDFLTPELLRILKPGRVAAIHVKDRILFGNVTGAGFPTLDPFHMTTTFHFMKHGFQFFGMITIETDVVRENNQTYRLGWTEQCKDGSKMGVGCPEYLLLFRKLPTDHSKGYADLPVMKSKTEYTRGQWPIDARAKWNSSGNRLLTSDEVENYDLDTVNAIFSKRAETMIYDYEQHLAAANAMDERGRLPATFETFRIPARTPWVWDDVCRMRTLNCNQSQRGAEKHVCPLQFDIVDRVITRWSNPGELVFDPFCGIGTVPYCAIKLNRRGYGSELNTGYWEDSCMYCTAAEREIEAPTLFDMEQYKDKENGNA